MSTSCSNARTTLRMVEFQLENVFLVIFILNMDVKPNVVEFFILGQSKARMARMARQRMVGSAITRTTPESCTEKYKESCMETSEREDLNCCQVHLNPDSIRSLAHVSIFCSFWQFRVQTVATAMKATGGRTDNIFSPRPYACTQFFSLRTSHVNIRVVQASRA